jgi:L,D-transpeptidase ErfK/SrfK
MLDTLHRSHGCSGIVCCLAALLAASLPGLPAAAASYTLGAGAQVVGEDLHIQATYSDTLYALGEKYGIGSEEIIRANPHVDPWLPGEGTDILIPGRQILPPGPREGIVVNIPEHRLYYFPKRGKHGAVVITYPVSIGSMDWKTPEGQTRVIQKISNPTWHPPVSIREEHKKNGDPLPAAVPPGPKNPLGKFALRLDLSPGDYLIHGTNNPLAVGMPVTHGCIRLYPQDIAALFTQVPVGTQVRLLNVPMKVAVVDGEILVQAQPPAEATEAPDGPHAPGLQELMHMVSRAAAASDIDWNRAQETLTQASGVLTSVGHISSEAALRPAALHVSLHSRARHAARTGHAARQSATQD